MVAGPMDVADFGRMTIMKDPQGAMIHLWQPRANCGVGVLEGPGTMSGLSLLVSRPPLPVRRNFLEDYE